MVCIEKPILATIHSKNEPPMIPVINKERAILLQKRGVAK